MCGCSLTTCAAASFYIPECIAQGLGTSCCDLPFMETTNPKYGTCCCTCAKSNTATPIARPIRTAPPASASTSEDPWLRVQKPNRARLPRSVYQKQNQRSSSASIGRTNAGSVKGGNPLETNQGGSSQLAGNMESQLPTYKQATTYGPGNSTGQTANSGR